MKDEKTFDDENNLPKPTNQADNPLNSDKPEEAPQKDTPQNPLEELQKKLEGLFGNGRVQVKIPNFHGSPDISAPSDTPPDSDDGAEENKAILKRIREFSMKPRDIRDWLNRFVVKQDEAKKVLSVAVCDHFNHIRRCLENPKLAEEEYTKPNILILGPTGVGKTYLMRTVAKMIGVPFVKADATKFSETGYVGGDVEDMVRDLIKMAHGDVELAQYGIIYIDEIDKIAGRASAGGKDVSGRGVQINLLKIMEDSNVNVFGPQDMMGQMQMMMSGGGKKKPRTISTRHILFIVSGAFDDLAKGISKRMNSSSIGFAGALEESRRWETSEFLKHAQTEDFIKYGFEAEFIGRLPVRVACDSLSAGDLAEILRSSKGSILRQYREDFAGYGINFNITPQAIDKIASLAHAEKTGARGLVTVLERIFRNFKFELPSSGVKEFEVDTDTVDNPKQQLEKILFEHRNLRADEMMKDLDRYAENFERTNGLKITFSAGAAEELMAESVETDKTLWTLCEEKFKDFKHGLAIIARNSSKTSFEITAAAVKDPDGELSKWVMESFSAAVSPSDSGKKPAEDTKDSTEGK